MDELFGGPEVQYIESPSESETDQEAIDRLRKERDAQAAFFNTLREGGAEELRKPTTGLNF